MLQGMTAHYLVESTYRVQDGDDVLVHAAAGGMGLLVTQIATAKGARVIGTTSTPEKAEIARAAGAAEVVLYGRGDDGQGADVAAMVREITGGKGVEVVYDGVGRSTFTASLDSLARRGTLALYGGASGPVESVDPMTLNAKGSVFLTRPTLAHHVESRDELLARSGDVFGWIGSGTVNFRIGQRYPLADARRAHEDLEGRRTTGKLLLVP
jgi:NADPH2:quinone reductase